MQTNPNSKLRKDQYEDFLRLSGLACERASRQEVAEHREGLRAAIDSHVFERQADEFYLVENGGWNAVCRAWGNSCLQGPDRPVAQLHSRRR